MSKAISQLSSVTDVESGDLLAVVDVSPTPDETKQITVSDFFTNVPVQVDLEKGLIVNDAQGTATADDVTIRSGSKSQFVFVDASEDQFTIGGTSDPDYGELFVHGRDTGTGAANDIVATLGEDDDTVTVNDNNTTSLDLVRVQSPSLTSNSGFTVADLASLHITGAPDDSDANVTATNKWALKIDSGASYIGGDARLIPADVSADGGTQNSPVLTLRAKHDSDTTAGVTSSDTDYTVEFVSQLTTGSQTGHVEHSVGSNTNQLVFDADNNRVGFGEASPLANVHVTQDQAALTEVRIDNTDASGSMAYTIHDGSNQRAQYHYDTASALLTLGTDIASGQLSLATNTDVEAVRIDSSGNVTHQQATTLTGNVTLQQPDDDYQITGRAAVLSIENTVSGNGAFLDVGTADADGSDGIGVRLFGVGRSGATNAEFFSLSAETDGTNIAEYRIGSSTSGTGSHRPVKIVSGGNTDQFVVQVSDGIAAKFPNTATGTGLLVETNDGSSQEIKRDSSTLRHKHNVQTLDEVDPEAVLGIDPIRYTETPDGDAFKISFGAEHFESIGLGEGLAYDGQGRVAGFLAGSRVIDAAQQVVLQDHEDRLSSLEDQVQEMAA